LAARYFAKIHQIELNAQPNQVMDTSRLIKFAKRALARGIAPTAIYIRAKLRFSASHSPNRIRKILGLYGVPIL
jgi:hypothetical protein